jgi:hypothetical protein
VSPWARELAEFYARLDSYRRHPAARTQAVTTIARNLRKKTS